MALLLFQLKITCNWLNSSTTHAVKLQYLTLIWAQTAAIFIDQFEFLLMLIWNYVQTAEIYPHVRLRWQELRKFYQKVVSVHCIGQRAPVHKVKPQTQNQILVSSCYPFGSPFWTVIVAALIKDITITDRHPTQGDNYNFPGLLILEGIKDLCTWTVCNSYSLYLFYFLMGTVHILHKEDV